MYDVEINKQDSTRLLILSKEHFKELCNVNFVHHSLTVNSIQKKIYGQVVNKVIKAKFASKSMQCNFKQTKKTNLRRDLEKNLFLILEY